MPAGLGTVEIEAMKREGFAPETAAAVTRRGPADDRPDHPAVAADDRLRRRRRDVDRRACSSHGVSPGLLMAGALMLNGAPPCDPGGHAAPPFEGRGGLWTRSGARSGR